jgi:3-hydroxyacyl-[acyl-carrier-protein] dehydratase
MRDAILAAAVGHVYKKEPDMFCRAYYFSSEFIGFAGHFPGKPVLPAIVQLMMAQILIEEYEEQPLKLSKVSRAKFIMPLQPEQEIITCCKESPAKSRNSQITASGDRRTANDFKWLQSSQRSLSLFACPRTEKFTFCRRLCKKADDKTFLYDIMLYQSDKLAASFRLSLVTRGQVLK